MDKSMKPPRDILTSTLVLVGIVIVILLFWGLIANAQTHTMPGSNVVPSGASLTIQSGGTITAAGGSTVTGFGGTPAWGSITGTLSSQTDLQTALNGKQATDTDLDTWATKTPYAGALTITTGKTLNATNSLTLSGTDGSTLNVGAGGTLGTAAYTASTAYQAADADLTAWAAKTTYAGDVTVTTGKTFNATNTLTLSGTDGSTLNVGAGGTLGTAAYTASTAYQAADSDLTTWAGVTPTSGIQTWLATPSSANLRAAVTDENGTGAILFSGATTPDFTTGFTIGAAAAAGKIPIGNGTNYVPSTPTWPTAAGTVGYQIRSDGTNFASYPSQVTNSSTANLTPSTSDIYLTGSSVVVAAGDFKQKGQYRCVFDMAKTAGTGGIVITLRIGTAGTTSDPAIQTFTFGSGTSVADTGVFDVVVNWRSVGGGTSAVVQGMCRGLHNLATTGLFNNAAGWFVIGSPSPSSGFNSSTATTMGLSFNGGTAFSGTNTLVQSQLQQ